MGDFWDRIDTLRKSAGMTQARLSKKLNKSHRTVESWKERGYIPTGDICLSIAGFFDVSVEFLLTGDEVALSDDLYLEEEAYLSMFDQKDLASQVAGFRFWRRVDDLRGKTQLVDIANNSGIDYHRIKNQRSDNRIPKIEDIIRLSTVLGCTIDYLVTGVDINNTIPKAVIPIVDALTKASDEDLMLIRRVLRITDGVVLS